MKMKSDDVENKREDGNELRHLESVSFEYLSRCRLKEFLSMKGRVGDASVDRDKSQLGCCGGTKEREVQSRLKRDLCEKAVLLCE